MTEFLEPLTVTKSTIEKSIRIRFRSIFKSRFFTDAAWDEEMSMQTSLDLLVQKIPVLYGEVEGLQEEEDIHWIGGFLKQAQEDDLVGISRALMLLGAYVSYIEVQKCVPQMFAACRHAMRGWKIKEERPPLGSYPDGRLA